MEASYLWLVMKKSLSHAKVHVLSGSLSCLGKVKQNPT